MAQNACACITQLQNRFPLSSWLELDGPPASIWLIFAVVPEGFDC